MILDEIIARKRIAIDQLKKTHSVQDLRRSARLAPAPRDFYRTLRDGPWPAIIAEIKKASPSAGVICPDLDLEAVVTSYEKGGAAAISVITEADFFLGKMEYLPRVRQLSPLPVLCKDFIVDPIQVLDARVSGADALLLIAAALDQDSLANLLETARSLRMACLVEVHDEEELERVLSTDARIVGINNRSLKTFEVILETTYKLCPLVPKDRLVVSESGIRNRHDVESLANAGVNAILVGTSLMRSDDREKKLRELRGVL